MRHKRVFFRKTRTTFSVLPQNCKIILLMTAPLVGEQKFSGEITWKYLNVYLKPKITIKCFMSQSSTGQINMSIYFIGLGKKGLKTKGMSGANTRHQRWHACFTNEMVPASKVEIFN